MVSAPDLWNTAEAEPPQDLVALNRQQLLDRIIAVNPTASEDFLGAFQDTALDRYHQRLTLRGCRGRESRWVRPDGECAVVWSQARD